jgi:hypothetical protein
MQANPLSYLKAAGRELGRFCVAAIVDWRLAAVAI